MKTWFLIFNFIIMNILSVRADDWPTFHYDSARTGNSLDKKISLPLKLLWEYKTGGVVRSSPAVVNEVVYIGSYDHKVYAIDAKTGKLKWSYITGGEIHSSPTVDNGIVYIGSSDGVFYALDANNGNVKWTYRVEGDSASFIWEGIMRTSSRSILSSPCVVGSIVYFGSGPLENRGGMFYALDGKTGEIKWQCKTRGGMYTSPAVSGGTVYFIEHDVLQVRDARNGNLKWSNVSAANATHRWIDKKKATDKDTGIGGQPCYLSGVSIGGGNIYFITWGWMGAVAAIDAETGAAKWVNQPMRGNDISFFSSGAICEGIVYFGFRYHRGQVQGFRTDEGSIAKEFPIYRVNSSPAVANGLLFAGADDGNVYACELESGKVLWSYGTEGKVRSSPAVAEGKLFIGSDDGNIYAFGPVE